MPRTKKVGDIIVAREKKRKITKRYQTPKGFLVYESREVQEEVKE